MEDQFEAPKWVPYTPPPPEGWARVRFWAGRVAFPLFALLFVVGLVLVFTTDVLTVGGTSQAPSPSAPGQTARYERPGGAEASDEVPGWLSVSTEPSGAWVTLNGREIGASPAYGVSVSPGRYMLTVEKSGFYRVDTVLVTRPGVRTSVDFTLVPRAIGRGEFQSAAQNQEAGVAARGAPTAARPNAAGPAARSPEAAEGRTRASGPAPPAYVRVESTPAGSEVWAGDRLVGITPALLRRDALADGTVTVRHPGYEPWTGPVTAVPGETRVVRAELRRARATLRLLVRPWGSIYVNDSLRARDHDIWFEATLPAGDHRVEAVHPVLGRRAQTVRLDPGERREVVIDLQTAGGQR
jgi:hypothetical protein